MITLPKHRQDMHPLFPYGIADSVSFDDHITDRFVRNIAAGSEAVRHRFEGLYFALEQPEESPRSQGRPLLSDERIDTDQILLSFRLDHNTIEFHDSRSSPKNSPTGLPLVGDISRSDLATFSRASSSEIAG